MQIKMTDELVRGSALSTESPIDATFNCFKRALTEWQKMNIEN